MRVCWVFNIHEPLFFSAINAKEVEVTFSKAVTGFNNTNAIFAAGPTKNYDILDPTGATIGGTANIAKITDAKYKVTTSAEMGVGEYTFRINKDVVTAAGSTTEKNPLQFVKFQGTAAKDTTPPVVSTANYNAIAKTVVVNFSEPVKVESVDKTKFVVTDGTTQVAFTVNESAILSNNDTTVTFGLSTATASAVAALGATKTLNVAEAAIKDKADNAIAAVTGVSLSPVAQLQSASFEAASNVLTLNFTKPVKVNTLTVSKLTLSSSAGAPFALVEGTDTIQTATNGKEVKIKLAETADTAAFKGSAVTNRKVTLTQDSTFKSDEAEPQTVLTSTVDVAYTADTGKPVLVSTTYNATAKKLVLTFSKPVKADAVAIGTNVKITDAIVIASGASAGTDTLNVAKMTTTLNTYSSILTFEDTTTIITATNTLSPKSKIFFAKDAFVDAAGNKNEAVTAANALPITYIDQTAPTVSPATATQLTLTKVQIKFDKPVTKATAETAANYTVKAPGAADLTVTSVELMADEVTAVITVAQEASIGVGYTIKVANVTSKYGNVAISTTAGNTATWTPTTPVPGTGPALTKVKFVDANSNYKIDAGDKLELTYDQQIVISGITKDDFALAQGTGSAVTTFGTGAAFTAGATSNQLVITLGTGVDISFGNTITPVATPHIKSLTGVNALASAVQTIASPDATLPAITKAEYEDTNADGKVSQGDRIVLAFSKNMDRAIAASTLLGNVTNPDAAGVTLVTSAAAVALGTGATAEWLDATTMRITLGATPNLHSAAQEFLGTATLVGGTLASVKDLWGNQLDKTQTPVAVEKTDKVRPTIQSVAIKAAAPTGSLAAGDKIVFTMSEAVNVAAAGAASDLILYQGTDATAKTAATADQWAVSGTTVTYTIHADDVAIIGVAAQNISTITFIPARAAKISDASGNTTVTPAGFGLVPTVSKL
ncbi:MAG: hypothetical protein GX295_12085 [Syntrophomonadaceae bacterium]|nr:hypothetical protein [Syntrophomonadaceae bacterium]